MLLPPVLIWDVSTGVLSLHLGTAQKYVQPSEEIKLFEKDAHFVMTFPSKVFSSSFALLFLVLFGSGSLKSTLKQNALSLDGHEFLKDLWRTEHCKVSESLGQTGIDGVDGGASVTASSGLRYEKVKNW